MAFLFELVLITAVLFVTYKLVRSALMDRHAVIEEAKEELEQLNEVAQQLRKVNVEKLQKQKQEFNQFRRKLDDI